MDIKRAKEIVSSPIMADVTYNGTSIYMESVNDNKHTANIHPIQQPQNTQEVSLDNLREH